MNKLHPAKVLLPSRDAFVKRAQADFGMTAKDARAEYRKVKQSETFKNDVYQVSLARFTADNGQLSMVHISIKRIDKLPIHDWRDLQQIKNELLGVECEAVELYPAESRRVDTVNQYHLWGIDDPTFRFPLGYEAREVWGESKGNTKQRPFDEQPGE